MGSTTERIIVDVDSAQLQSLVQQLGEATVGFENVAGAADGADLSQFNDGISQINANVGTLTRLNLAETVKSIGGTFNEVSSKLKFFETALKDIGNAAENPFARNLAVAGSAVVGYSGFALEAAGTTLELGAALAQIVTVFASLGGASAIASAAYAALTGAVVAAKAAVVAFAATVTVATAGIAAAVLAVVAAVAYLITSFIDAKKEAAALTEAMNANRDALNEYYGTFTEFTDQFTGLQAAREAADATLERTNVYLARQIALQRESLGLYEGAESAVDETLRQAEIRLRYFEQQSVQLDIQAMLLAGANQEDIMRVENLKFQAFYSAQTVDSMERWLDTAPQINQELLVTDEQMGNINSRISSFAGGLVGWFQTLGEESEEATTRSAGAASSIAREIDSLVRAREALDDSITARAQRVFEGDSVEQMIARQRLLRDATAEQAVFLLGIFEREDEAYAERARVEQERAEAEARRLQEERDELQRDLNERARITAERQAVEEAARAAELASVRMFNQNKMNLLFGGGEFTDQSEEMQKSLTNMSEEGASSLGVLNSSMNDLAAGFGSSMGAALMSGERVDKALKKALAGMLSSLGQTYLAQGAALMIPPPFNPLGNPVAGGTMLGVGALMMATSAAFGGVGGAKGAGKKAPSAPKNVESGKSSSVSVMNNFGFVSDRRAVARDVADTTRTAVRRGQ